MAPPLLSLPRNKFDNPNAIPEYDAKAIELVKIARHLKASLRSRGTPSVVLSGTLVSVSSYLAL